MKLFIDSLKDLIEENNLSLIKLGKLTGVSSSQISKYLRGTIPSLKNLLRLCDYFKCSLNYLLGLTDINECKCSKDFDLKIFLRRYNQLLEEGNITHWTLSSIIGISESSLRSWRSGKTPSIESLIKIAKYFNVSIDYLIGREEEL